MLSSGFSLAFGSMFAKTYRVHKIFTRSCTGIVRNKVRQSIVFILFGRVYVNSSPPIRRLNFVATNSSPDPFFANQFVADQFVAIFYLFKLN